MNWIFSVYKDGDNWCAAVGTYPACTNPEAIKVFAPDPTMALVKLREELEPWRTE